MLDSGSKLLIWHRQLFAEDWPRIFVGEVSDYMDGLARVTGYTFTKDPGTGLVKKKKDKRTKIVAIADGGFITYDLPRDTVIDNLSIEERSDDRSMLLVDGAGFEMDLSERP